MAKARLLVELDVTPGAAEAFAAMFRDEFIARSRREEGCEQYELWRDLSAPSRMTIVEVWRDRAALETHLAQDWFGTWAPKMEAAQATPLRVRTMVSVED